MCLRKLQRWALPPIVAEYTRFDRRLGLGLGLGLGFGLGLGLVLPPIVAEYTRFDRRRGDGPDPHPNP